VSRPPGERSGSKAAFARPGAFLRPVLVPLLLLASSCLLGAACRYRIGHPPPSVGLCVGDIRAPVVEPAVADAMASGLAAAIRRADAAGDRSILVSIEQASFEPAASREGQVLAWEATLTARFVLSGPEPRTLRLQRSSRVAAPSGTVDPTQLRGPAFELLATALADQAVSSFLYAPEPTQPTGEP
jgi:hypothetical protein